MRSGILLRVFTAFRIRLDEAWKSREFFPATVLAVCSPPPRTVSREAKPTAYSQV